jgi:hypothetical protein
MSLKAQIDALEADAEAGRTARAELERVKLLMQQVADVARALGVPGADAAPGPALDQVELVQGYERRIADLEQTVERAKRMLTAADLDVESNIARIHQLEDDNRILAARTKELENQLAAAAPDPLGDETAVRGVLGEVVDNLVECERLTAEERDEDKSALAWAHLIAESVTSLVEDLDCQRARAESAEQRDASSDQTSAAPRAHADWDAEPTPEELAAHARAKKRKPDQVDALSSAEHTCPTCGAEAGYSCNWKTSRMSAEGLRQAHDARRALSKYVAPNGETDLALFADAVRPGGFVVARTNTRPTRRTVFWNRIAKEWVQSPTESFGATHYPTRERAEAERPRGARVLTAREAQEIATKETEATSARDVPPAADVDAIKQQITSALNAQQEG